MHRGASLVFMLLSAGCHFEVPGLVVGAATNDLSSTGDLSTPPVDLAQNPDLRQLIGRLSGAVADSTNMTVDLTSGARDWVHFGLNSSGDVNRKAGVSPLISTFTPLVVGTLHRFSDNRVTFTWSDGSPTASSSATTDGVYFDNAPKGFSITAPADATTRKLKVYVSAYQADFILTAHLSDSSAPDYTDTQTNNVNSTSIYREYTFDYNAASVGMLKVSWYDSADHNGGGNVTLAAAILQ